MSVADTHADLVRLDGRLFRVVGRTTIGGVEHKVCAPVGRGPLRAVPVEAVEAESRRNTPSEHKPATGAQDGRPHHASPRQARPRLTPAERFRAALLPSPGRIGYLPIALLVAILTVLAAVLD